MFRDSYLGAEVFRIERLISSANSIESDEEDPKMANADEGSSAKRWLPLEANPDVMNQVLLHSPIFTYFPTGSANYSSDHRNFEIGSLM